MKSKPSRLLESCRNTLGPMASDSSFGMTGAWSLLCDGERLKAVSSDGSGWDHVSVSIADELRCPTWDEMCYVKNLFFRGDEWVMQLHPPRAANINCHPGCLHMWRPNNGREIPVPPSSMVGPTS